MIEARGIVKRFGDFLALDHVDLAVRPGELLALLGPSGSGKTTLLRVIAGLEHADAGKILLDDQDATHLDVRDRSVGFVFQHYALFRHMTVLENVAFGQSVKPRRERPPKAEIVARARELLRLVQIDWLADRYPGQLSGGQRQRVALARALAIEPRVLLLDEPFGALDAKVRRELRRWLRRLHDEIGMTTVFVTHDQAEAMEVADRVVVMGGGRIEQIGTAEELYDRPRNAFVYEFLGDTNRIDLTAAGITGAAIAGAAPAEGVGFVRPHDLTVHRDPQGNATIRFIAFAGGSVRLEVDVDGVSAPLDVDLPRTRFRDLDLAVGDRVTLEAQAFHSF